MRLPAYPKYKPSGVDWLGDVPEDWTILPLKRRHRIVNGGTPASSEDAFWDGDINWLTPEDLGRNESMRIGKSRRTLSLEGLAHCGARLVPAHSIVISTRAPIGHVAVTEIESCTNQGCRALIPEAACSHADFTYYALLSSRSLLQAAGKGTTFLELSAGALGLHALPFPPIEEQLAIVEFLNRETAKVDTLVSKKRTLIERLMERRTALISLSITRGLPLGAARAASLDPAPKMKPSGIDWLGEVPEHWDVKRLKAVATYWVSNVDKVPADDELPIRLCNYTDVYYHDHIMPTMGLMETTATLEEVRQFGLKVGDVVITKDSEEWSDIAVPALVVESAPDLVCGYHLAIVRPTEPELVGRFLLRAFQACAVNQQFQVAATGVTRYGLPKSSIGEAWLPLPPQTEQLAIADFLDRETAAIDRLVTKITAAIERLQEYRSALISAAVSGKIDVRGAAA